MCGVIWATSTFDMERGSELGERRRERRKIESEGGSEGGSKKEKSSVRENRTSGAKRVKSLQVRASSIALSHAFHPLAVGWYMVRWYEPNHIVLYHVCVRTTLCCQYNIPNARNIHVAQTRCPLEGTAHATRSHVESKNPVLDGASRNARSIPMPSKTLCHAIFYAMSAQKMSNRDLLDLDRKRPRRVVSQWPFARNAPRR